MLEHTGATTADAQIRSRLTTVGGGASGRFQAFVTGLPQEGDMIGRYQFGALRDGEDQNTAQIGAAVIVKASADWTEGNSPSVMEFHIAGPTGQPIKVASLDSDGNLTINGILTEA